MQTTFKREPWFLNLFLLTLQVEEARFNLELKPMDTLPENDNEIVVSEFIEKKVDFDRFLVLICEFNLCEDIEEPQRAI